jgi:GAF domain-containing protein/HAMP domain-containing protein
MSKLSSTPQKLQTGGPSASRSGGARKDGKIPTIYTLSFQLFVIYLLLMLLPLGALTVGMYFLTQNIWIPSLVGLIFIGLIPLGLAKAIRSKASLPVNRLTRVAKKVASGSLWEKAPEGRDEIGQLGLMFNTMITELRLSLDNLERRNAALASDLAHASEQTAYQVTQLHTVAEVARAIASVQDPDLLLQQVTELISERFKFYHVAIFLLDRKGEYAILQAANSEGGQRMLAQGYRLKVNQDSLVGSVAAQGEPRLTRPEEVEANHFDNPDLPYTRSELAIPLKAADKVIGVLDAQSMEPSAFTPEDIPLLNTIADQIAVAIENVRLYTETRKALAELEATHRHYLREQWAGLVEERQAKGYQYQYGRLGEISDSELFVENLAGESQSDQIVLMENSNLPEGPLIGVEIVAPITVRGQWIGSLKLGDKQQTRQWSEEDIHLIRAVADQVGLALENSRLLEETHRRAEREHLVSEITTKLRASNDPQVILQTAMNELRQALKTKRTQFVAPKDIALSQEHESKPTSGLEEYAEVNKNEVI